MRLEQAISQCPLDVKVQIRELRQKLNVPPGEKADEPVFENVYYQLEQARSEIQKLKTQQQPQVL